MTAELNKHKKTSTLIAEALDICQELKNRGELSEFQKYDVFDMEDEQ